MRREIKIGNLYIGGKNNIAIQSMTNTKTHDVIKTVEQIKLLEKAGCEIIRVAIPTLKDAQAIDKIKENISIPLVADIHFDYKLALEVMERGIDKIRINPGNIGSEEKIEKVIKKAKKKNIPIRVGVNAGSLEKELVKKYGVCEEAIVESALNHIKLIEKYDYENIVVSMKSSSIPFTLKSYELLAKEVDYPLHIGITEAGTIYSGTIKSAAGIGALLSQGYGDTMRVSLTSDPVEEIKCCKEILKSLELRSFGPTIISCPTCGRTEIGLIELANKVEEICSELDVNLKIAVMGCIVNGPGESKEADLGIAGGKEQGLIFKKGKIVAKVPEDKLLEEFTKILKEMVI
ncbi:MAG: flavodoxin-dependent (E)-4-hydroxy-3-methylbut-2-enyl-diphosphate synthase [Lachnospirales bacterium]